MRAQADKCVFISLLPPCSGRFPSFCWWQGELVFPEAGASSSGYKQRQFVGSRVSRGATGPVGEGPRPGHLRPQGATPFSMTPHSRGPVSEDFLFHPTQPRSGHPPAVCLTVLEPPGTNEKPGVVALPEEVVWLCGVSCGRG